SIKVDFKFVSFLHISLPPGHLLCGHSEGEPRNQPLTDTSFAQPMTWPDKITVYYKLTHAPPTDPNSARSTWDLSALILSEARQRPAARCHEDLTTYDYRLGK